MLPVAGQKKSPKKGPQGKKKEEKKSSMESEEDTGQVEPEEEEEEPKSKRRPAGKKSAGSKAGKAKEPKGVTYGMAEAARQRHQRMKERSKGKINSENKFFFLNSDVPLLGEPLTRNLKYYTFLWFHEILYKALCYNSE
jgi:hypothetical protein